MSDRTYTCTTAGCPRQRQPTGARWCVVCSTPTQSEPAAPLEPAPAGDPGLPAPGGPPLSAEWRPSVVTAVVAVGAMLAFSLLLVALLAVAAPGQRASDNVGSLIRLAVTLVPLSMRGALVVGGTAPSTGADQGQLTLVLPPLLGAVVGLTALAVAASRRVREAPPPTPGPLALEALRTGAAFAALMGLATLLTYGTVQDAATGRLSWHVSPIGVACWSALLGTLAAGLGGVAGVVRTGQGRELLAAASPVQRGWLRALGGGAVAAGTALALGSAAVAVLVGVGMSRYAATEASSLIQIPPGPVVGLAALFLPGAALQALGFGLGATLVAAGSPDDTTRAGYLAGSGLPGWTYLLLLVPALAVVAGGLWAAAREQAEPEPQPGGWLRYAAATTALFGLLLVLARIKVDGSTAGGVTSVLPLLPSSGQDRVSAVVGFRLVDGLLLAFGWAALGGVVAERLFPVLLLRYGRRVARVRVGPLGLLPASAATAQQPRAPKRRTRTAGMLAATVAVVGVAVWLGAGPGPAGTPDGSVAAEAATPTTTVAVTEPTLGVPHETLTTPSSSPEVAGSRCPSSPGTHGVGLGYRPRRRGCRGQPDQLLGRQHHRRRPADRLAGGGQRPRRDPHAHPAQPRTPDPGRAHPRLRQGGPQQRHRPLPREPPGPRGPLALRRRDHRRPAFRRQPDHAGHRRRHDHQLGNHPDPQHPGGDPRPRLRAHLGGVARRQHPVSPILSREPGVTPDQVTAEQPGRHAAPGIPTGRRGGRAARGLGRAGRLTRSGG